ncbi:hypothetical protein [Paenibacillus sp. LHD-38]|uniref:hypothetical protein n=1 Tax=Paenibacillus sp. LHD-38 TaxID=3072143 RepID=UPI00280CC792|nr:hypothetical protein [Paenibacillus sp. LHD-38]MDQ8736750.1 hypothetical protein [Paenibacillus sp. LHD-38]
MNWKKCLIALVSALSIITGIFYMNGLGFSFAFMVTEIGSEQAAVQFWSRWSIGLGIILLVTLLLRNKMKAKVNDGQLIFVLSLLFLIQLPPFALWLFTVILGNGNALVGIFVHSLMIVLLVRIVTIGRRSGTVHI